MMKLLISTPAIALAGAAMLSLAASPAMARGWHHRHYDRGLDTGDVLAGLLIIGGIAAVASAASNASKTKRERNARDDEYRRPPTDEEYRDYRAQNDGYGYGDDRDERDGRPYGQSNQMSGIDEAVETCADEIERGDRRIETVDAATREGSGWRIEGNMADGRSFSCSVDADGRVRRAAIDGHAVI